MDRPIYTLLFFVGSGRFAADGEAALRALLGSGSQAAPAGGARSVACLRVEGAVGKTRIARQQVAENTAHAVVVLLARQELEGHLSAAHAKRDLRLTQEDGQRLDVGRPVRSEDTNVGPVCPGTDRQPLGFPPRDSPGRSIAPFLEPVSQQRSAIGAEDDLRSEFLAAFGAHSNVHREIIAPMYPPPRMPPRLGAFLAVVFWGISFVATKAAVGEISPVALIFARTLLATLFLSAVLAQRGQPPWPPRDALAPIALMGFVGVTVHQTLQAYALTLTSAVNTGWLVGLTPIWSALFAAWALHERFGPRKVLGLALGCMGAILVVTRGRWASALALPSTQGDLMILASTLNWALYTVLGHDTVRRLGPARATAGAMFLGWLMLVPLFLSAGAWREYAHLTTRGSGAIVFLGVASSGLGYLFWYGALARIETSRVASFLYLEPLVTLAAAAFLLGEPVSPATIGGGLLLLGGVALVQRS
jgi:drug/metabolite transporter (DMT)-like permease